MNLAAADTKEETADCSPESVRNFWTQNMHGIMTVICLHRCPLQGQMHVSAALENKDVSQCPLSALSIVPIIPGCPCGGKSRRAGCQFRPKNDVCAKSILVWTPRGCCAQGLHTVSLTGSFSLFPRTCTVLHFRVIQ